MNNITIIGAGYVGLVVATCFSELGKNVVCIDRNEKKVEVLNRGKVPFYEQGLSDLISKNIEQKRIEFSRDIEYAVKKSDIVYIAVGTPSKEDGNVELSFLHDAVRDIAYSMNGYKIIVNKSTVPVGTCRRLKKMISNHLKTKGIHYDFDVVSNPEFLREGSAVEDFMNPDRIVIGTDSDRARSAMTEIYNVFDQRKVPFIFTNYESAELIKYAANCFLAMKIAYVNEIANLCEKVGADIQHVTDGIGKDHRISSKFLLPGPGYGGSCFPKDNLALLKIAQEYGEEVSIIDQVVKSNEKHKLRIVDKIKETFGVELEHKKIAILGLTFKSNTNDMREAASLVIVPKLIESGAQLQVFDPEGIEEAKQYFEGIGHSIKYCQDELEAIMDSDAVVILTEWERFKSIDLSLCKANMNGQHIFDLRNIYDREYVEELGFNYVGIGR